MQIALDRYVIDTLMRDLVGHDRKPSSYLVYVALLGLEAGGRRSWSHAALAEQTGLSKRAVQDAIRHLAARELISVARTHRAEAARLETRAPWHRRQEPSAPT